MDLVNKRETKMKLRKHETDQMAYYVNREPEDFETFTAPVLMKCGGFASFADGKGWNFSGALREMVKFYSAQYLLPSADKRIPNKVDYCFKYELSSREYCLVQSMAQAMVSSEVECHELYRGLIADKLDQSILSYLLAKAGDEDQFVLDGKVKRISKWQGRFFKNCLDPDNRKPNVFAFGKSLYYEQDAWKNHEEWKAEYDDARNCIFGARGSSDELGGNTTYRLFCVGTERKTIMIAGREEAYQVYRFKVVHSKQELGYFELPAKQGKQLADILEINNRKFECTMRGKVSSAKLGDEKLRKDVSGRTPLKVFFMRKGNSWNIYVSFPLVLMPLPAKKSGYAIGLDLNNGHLDVTRVGLDGRNLVIDEYRVFEYDTEGDKYKREEQLYAHIREIVAWAKLNGDILALEYLDFEGSKRWLRNKLGSILHVLPYKKIIAKFERECHKAGVELRYVRPAYTSLLGNLIATDYPGLGRDVAASVVIALRGLEGGNFWLDRRCLKYLKAERQRLRINDKGRFGRDIICVMETSGDSEGTATGSVVGDTSRSKSTKPTLYGVQVSAGDSISGLVKASRPHARTNGRIECRILNKGAAEARVLSSPRRKTCDAQL